MMIDDMSFGCKKCKHGILQPDIFFSCSPKISDTNITTINRHTRSLSEVDKHIESHGRVGRMIRVNGSS